MSSYSGLPDHSRVWVYQSSRILNSDETQRIKREAKVFLNQWAAHGKSLLAAIEVFYCHFIVIIVDEEKASASGCSIDSSFKFIQKLESGFEISLLDRLLIAYRKNKEILVCRIDDFENKIKSGEINENTIVFNNLVDTKKAFDTQWEVLLKDSWHRKMLPSQ